MRPVSHFARRRIAILLLPLAAAVAATPAHAIEEPEFRVLRQIGEIELRQYAPYVVAEVVVPGPAADAGNQAFPILAGYIFGKNKGERTFAMTAPVTQTPAAAAAPVKFAMTAPVTQAATTGGYLVQFVLPRGVTAGAAPEPLDARVQLREVPGKQVAVLRYSGFWSAANDAEHLARLEAGLRAAGISWAGEPVLARYDSPWTPWFMRRNEVWLRVAGG